MSTLLLEHLYEVLRNLIAVLAFNLISWDEMHQLAILEQRDGG